MKQTVPLRLLEGGVNVNTLHAWISKLHRPKDSGKTAGKQKHNDEHVYDELKRLRKENAKLKEERAILKKADIRVIHEKNRELYGERRIKDDLADMGKTVSRKRIGRLMKEEGLECKAKRQFRATTDSSHNKPVADNLLKRDFDREQPDQAYSGISPTFRPGKTGSTCRSL